MSGLRIKCPVCLQTCDLSRLPPFTASCGCPVSVTDSGFPNLLPPLDELTRAYLETYLGIATDDLASAIQEVSSLEDKATKDLENIGPIPPEAHVLEIGPASGTLARKLASMGVNVTCVDLIDTYWTEGNFPSDTITCVLADAQALPFRETFDLVVMTDVLEHVFRPADVLWGALRALVPGGRLYVRSPANEALATYGQLRGCRYPLVHLRSYDKRSLRRELVAAGFHVGHNLRYMRGDEWRFPNGLGVRLRDRILGAGWTDGTPRKRQLSDVVYRLSQQTLGRWALTSPIEVWALATAAADIEPLSFSGSDANYVGLIQSSRGVSK